MTWPTQHVSLRNAAWPSAGAGEPSSAFGIDPAKLVSHLALHMGMWGCVFGWTFNVRQPTFVFLFWLLKKKNIRCNYTAKRPVNRDWKLLPKGRHNLWAASFLAASTSSCGGKPMMWCNDYLMPVVEHIIYNLSLSVVQSIPQKLSLGAHSNLAMGIVGARINSWINWMPPTSSSNVTEPFSNMIVYDLGLCSGHPNWCWDSSQSLPFAWACAHDKVGMSRILGWLGFMICWPDSDLKQNMLACDDGPPYVW